MISTRGILPQQEYGLRSLFVPLGLVPSLRDIMAFPSPIGSTSRGLWEQHQINQAEPNNIAKVLKIKLSVTLQSTKVSQDLCAKPKHNECLLNLKKM